MDGNVGDEKYKGKFLFTMKDFVSFRKYDHSIYFISIIFLKDMIDGVCVPQFQLA